MAALMFLGGKDAKSIKSQMVYNGKPTHKWLLRADTANPTATLESIMLTAIVDAKEGHHIMTCNIPQPMRLSKPSYPTWSKVTRG